MADEIDPNIRSNIEGVGNIETWPYPFGPHADSEFKNAYPGQGLLEVYPQGNEGNKDYHPYELEFHVDDDNNVELRCYYGTIYYSITGIQLEAFDDNDTSDANKRFGIKGQRVLPGIGNITPAGFISRDDGTNKKYCGLGRGKLDARGNPPDKCFGTVYLVFYVDSNNRIVSEAEIQFIEKGEELEEEEPVGELKRVGTDKLLRDDPRKGKYHLKIGSFNSPKDTPIPITQSIEDHVYYATTIVEDSEAPSPGDGSSFSYTTTATPPAGETFSAAKAPDPVDPDNPFIPTTAVEQPNQPNPTGGSFSNQPNYKDDHAVGGLGIDAQQPDPVFEDETEEQLTVPPQDTGDTFFGGHGGGPIVTTDSDDYIDSGSISGLTEIYEEQIEDPTGGGTSSATSTSYSNTT